MFYKKGIYFVLMMAMMLLFYPVETVWSHGGPPPDPSTLIAQWDQDGDGVISSEEFKGPEEHFSQMDTDGDGYLTVDELEAGRPAPPGGAGGFENDDADGDGMISSEEFKGPEELFSQMDTDGDGNLTAEELEAGRPAPPGGAGGFENDDADGDGMVSAEEFSGGDDLFQSLDADGDGYISREEAHPAKGMGHPGPPPISKLD